MITDPLGKYDCCLTTDGGCAFIVTTGERAAEHPNPIFIESMGFGHSTGEALDQDSYRQSGMRTAARQALRHAVIPPPTSMSRKSTIASPLPS